MYDLVRKQGGSGTIPNVEETQAYLNRNYEPATEEQVQKHFANIRAVLKMERREGDEQI